MPVLELRGVSHHFGSFTALYPLDLSVERGEFVTLLGPSGSGKTTLLNVAAGYCSPSSGRVLVSGQDVTTLPPRKRHIGMVFQSYALFPHLNVFENVAFGLRVRKTSASELKKRVNDVLELFQLIPLSKRLPSQLSGGQQQRVAVARALVIEPAIMLFDEPFGALDRQLRKQIQIELRMLHRKIGATMVFVTHDQEESLILSDRIAVMRAGCIEQLGTGRELYGSPANSFVAGFLGESNLLPGKVRGLAGGRAAIELSDIGKVVEAEAALGLSVGADAVLVVRPEALRLNDSERITTADVIEVLYLGDKMDLRLRLPSGFVLSSTCSSDRQIEVSETVSIGFSKHGPRIVPQV